MREVSTQLLTWHDDAITGLKKPQPKHTQSIKTKAKSKRLHDFN